MPSNSSVKDVNHHGIIALQQFSGDGDSSIHDDDNCRNSFDGELRKKIEDARRNPDTLIQDYAPSSLKLGMFSTGCLVITQIIGSGIFETPKAVWLGTRSVSGAIFMWLLGSLITFAGLSVYLELGLTIPRYCVDGKWRTVPRSGGEKNYLEYMFRKPKFLATSAYAMVFIFLQNTSGNAVVFGTKVLEVLNYPDPVNAYDRRTGWIIKGLAVATITAACLLHGAWRAGGIWVQNTTAIVKLGILWFFILAGLATYSGKINGVQNPGRNLSSSSSFKTIDTFTPYGAHGWITALLDVTFSYNGFGNINYVLSEVKHPEKELKLSSMVSVTIISISYIMMNISFFIVVRPEQLMTPDNPSISNIFIQNIFNKSSRAQRVLPLLVAISAFGNILATTFTASIVKQEIAKEGVLPFSSFWRSQYISPYRRLFSLFSSSPQPYLPGEKTPIPGILLHWMASLIMVLAPSAGDSYVIFTRLYSYMIVSWIGAFLAGGLLYYGYFKQYRSDRIGSKYRWKNNAGFRPWLGPVFPLFYFLICSTVIVGIWVPPLQGEDESSSSVKWFIVPIVGASFFVAGIVYWFVLRHVIPLWSHKTLRVKRTPFLDADENFRYEEVITKWIAGPEEEDEDEGDPDLR